MADHLFMTEVTQPILIKDDALFLVSRPDGSIGEGDDGAGLHFHDTRYLSHYALRIGGRPPMRLMASSAGRGDEAVLQFSNYDIDEGAGRRVQVQGLEVELRRTIDGRALRLEDEFLIESFAPGVARFSLALELDAKFEDLFQLRGAKPRIRGVVRRTATEAGAEFHYEGADKVRRRIRVSFSPRPAQLVLDEAGPLRAVFDLALGQRETARIQVGFQLAEIGGAPRRCDLIDEPWLDDLPIRSDNPRFDAALARSFRDLRLLRTTLEHGFIAGGLPWYVAPFARDSIISALQILPFDARPAVGIARVLARYQGRHRHRETGEQPGKIPHELRVGEMAHLEEIPHRPSYVSVDSTPLFLILIGRHVAWTGRLELFNELRDAVERALAWLRDDADTDGDGYVDYAEENADGPVNRGWKDSSGSIVNPDGSMPKPPIALCEIQGYVRLAKTLIGQAYRLAGDDASAGRLLTEATDLAERFNRDFWMEDEGCFCLALARGGMQVRAVASNAGHALWSGIAEPEKAHRTANRLLQPDMSSGWGVRTFSRRHLPYNPLHYHLGSVWPFDNALLVEGLVRYGLQDEAAKLFEDVLDAADAFSLSRLPEFYVGFERADGLFPARCPFAEPLQAWSAGALPAMTAALLGLRGIGGGRLEVEAPRLPRGVSRLTLILHGPDGDAMEARFAGSSGGPMTIEALTPDRELEISGAAAPPERRRGA